MKAISTGFARCASMSLVRCMATLGAHSFHEPCGFVPNIDDWLERAPYDVKQYPLDLPPYSVVTFCDFWPASLPVREKDSYFVADWSMGLVMYELQRRQPDIRWYVTLRDPTQQISSLMAYRHGTKVEPVLDKWLGYHLFMLRQLQRMDKRPFVIEFDKLVSGAYDGWLMGPYGGCGITDGFWTKKTNSAGKYKAYSLGGFAGVCEAIQNAIRDECEIV